jgi:hypothetical protein
MASGDRRDRVISDDELAAREDRRAVEAEFDLRQEGRVRRFARRVARTIDLIPFNPMVLVWGQDGRRKERKAK